MEKRGLNLKQMATKSWENGNIDLPIEEEGADVGGAEGDGGW